MKLHTKILAGLLLTTSLNAFATVAVTEGNSPYTVSAADLSNLPVEMGTNSTVIWGQYNVDTADASVIKPAGNNVTDMNVTVIDGGLVYSDMGNTSNSTIVLAPGSTLTVENGGRVLSASNYNATAVSANSAATTTGTINVNINSGGQLNATVRGGTGTVFGIIGHNKGDVVINNQGNILFEGSGTASNIFGITDLTIGGVDTDSGEGQVSGDFATTLINSGNITAQNVGDNRAWVLAVSQGSQITNTANGVITSTHDTTDLIKGIEIFPRTGYQVKTNVLNAGTINVTNTGGPAIGLVMGDHAVGSNTGSINVSASGALAAAVFLNGVSSTGNSDISYTNEGTITVTNNNEEGRVVGIVAGGGYVTVTNTGIINVGKTNPAIAFTGQSLTDTSVTNSTLNYYTSGHLNGRILFSTSSNNTNANKLQLFSSEDGLDQAIFFEGNADVSTTDANLIVKTKDLGNGTTEVDITNTVPHVTPHMPANNALSKVNSGIVGRGINAQLVSDMNNHMYKKHQATGFNMWVDSYGENKHRPKDGGIHRIHTKFGGLTFGADKAVSDKSTAGFFVGALKSHMDIGLGANTKVKSSGALVGAYGNTMFNDVLLNGILEVGYIHHKRERSVYESNIDDTTGKTVIKANNHEYFVSPAVTVAKMFKAGDTDVVPSLTVRYTGQKVSKLNEGVSGVAHTVKGRFVSSAASRAQVATTKAINDNSSINFYGGLEYTKLLTNKVKLENLGSDNQSETVKVKKVADTDAFFGVKLNHLVKSAVTYVGLEGTKGLKKGDGGKNYSVALSLGADF